MADIPVLCLVPNRGGSMALVFEGRSYKLKRTGKQKKCWRCSKLPYFGIGQKRLQGCSMDRFRSYCRDQ
ncbi:hypothetical protein T06_11905 [Trichinella sp. T6]|nr:hypothetical protein T06_11905 [Trichinella sp. T6]